ncbi:Glycosyltransferase involved in cell wall bisynthesis [Pseudorhodobacter antarcticus]|uniref:Glycosyltransferase involved in cell wall bisynthesis n=1 Tax=Pseudorhodobacter antarcticus TaxID=1077947 RepID=A0A1H8FIA8_9RHOB|nr:glycosyltransferase [Pseudorhodobacter antarcticus]SEN31365.1 Glycosyltransferase involved in cell wall bisynthesis [Pseudorhodobacter antarcticus]
MLAPTRLPPAARLLDLTRLLSRLGKGQPTGVDRVEAAYLAHLLAHPCPCFALLRSKMGFLLLGRPGMQAFSGLMSGQIPLPPADMLSRLTRRRDPILARAETALRRLAIARALPHRLGHMMRAHLPRGVSYLNTGHANLSHKTLATIKSSGAQVSVLLHDTIPLDHPEYTRASTIAGFDAKLAATAAHADLVIHSAAVTRHQTETHLARHGRIPPGVVASLGLTALHPTTLPPRAKPYFVTLGTIEPRKNHGFLLDLWDQMHRTMPGADIPDLLILGRRGWENAAVFARLDALHRHDQTVFELPNLPDDHVAGLLQNASALLFPSHVEGFGLPPLEAASLGVAVILPPLPIYRETLGDYPVYASLEDSYSWLETIIRLTDGKSAQDRQEKRALRLPQWADHFNTVLNLA